MTSRIGKYLLTQAQEAHNISGYVSVAEKEPGCPQELSEPLCFIIMYQSCFSDPRCLSAKDVRFSFSPAALCGVLRVCTWYSRSGFCSPTDEDRCTKGNPVFHTLE